jgi:cytochrome b6-f complex iron-sulfur subunit
MKPRRVASFVDHLLRNRRPRTFGADTEDAQAIRAAIELRAAQPGAAEPDDQFVQELRERLREGFKAPSSAPDSAAAKEPARIRNTGGRALSRRRLLEGAGIAASAAVVAVVADRAIEGEPGQHPLVPNGGRWVTVASGEQVDSAPITPFSTEDVVGFVVNQEGTLRGLSGVCTHQGCLLHPNDSSDRLDCPCHRAAFSLEGQVLFHQFDGSIPPLPTIGVRRVGNDVQILLPPPARIV